MRRVTGVLLWLYVFTVPWEVVAIPGVGTIARFVGIIASSAAILTIAIEGRFRKPDVILGLAIAFTLLTALSLLWTISYPLTVGAVWQYAQLLGSVWLVRELARTKEQQQSLLLAFCLGAFVPVVSLLYNFWTGVQFASSGRYSATGYNPNGMALMMAIGIPIAWHLVLTRGGTVRAIALIYSVLAPVGVLLTGSRGGFLAGIVALLIVPLSLTRQRLRLRLVVAVLLVLIASTIGLIVPQSLWARMGTIPDELAAGSLSERRDIWKSGLDIFPNHPLLGVGAGAFGLAGESSPEFRINPSRVAHNVLIGLLIEQGILGVALFTALLSACAVIIFGMPPPDRKLWAVLMLCWLVALGSGSIERWKVTWLLFGLIAAYGDVGPIRRHTSRRK